MTENLVPDQLTPASRSDVYAAMRLAAPELSRGSCLLLVAQWAFETGNGRAMHCNNIGNIKYTPGCGHDYTQFRCNEIIGGQEVWFDPPNPATSFRAYGSLTEGVADYVALLKKHFSGAWAAAQPGDVGAFAKALKAAHYYTADEAVYEHGLRAIVAELDAAIPQDNDGITPGLLGQEAAQLAGDAHDADPAPPDAA